MLLCGHNENHKKPLIVLEQVVIWYTANTLNISVLTLLSISSSLVVAAVLCIKREDVFLEPVESITFEGSSRLI